MNSKIIDPALLMMVLMASESMARGYDTPWRSAEDQRRPLRQLRPLKGFTEELNQLQRVCDVFADESSVAKQCKNIKDNVETFQSKANEEGKAFMNEQMANLEDVVISVCKAMNDADFVATGNDQKIQYKDCKKLVIPRRYGGILTIYLIFCLKMYKSALYILIIITILSCLY